MTSYPAAAGMAALPRFAAALRRFAEENARDPNSKVVAGVRQNVAVKR